MAKREAHIKKAVKEILAKHSAYIVMYVPTGFGNAGVPDFIASVYGRFIGIETKLNAKKNPPTALQMKNLCEIQQAGGLAVVVDETNIDSLDEVLSTLKFDAPDDLTRTVFGSYSCTPIIDPLAGAL